MRATLRSTGLLVSLYVGCVGACTAKQRDFMPSDPGADATEGQRETSAAPNPESEGDAGATPTTAESSSSGRIATASDAWSPDSSSGAPGASGDNSVPAAASSTDSTSAAGASAVDSVATAASSGAVDATSNPAQDSDTSPPTLWDDLVLHLSMDDAEWTSGGSIHDGSAAANHGTLNGSVAQTADGKFDKAAVFDGDGWIGVPDSDSLDASAELTMSAWVNFGYVGGGYSPGIISKRAGFGDKTAYTMFLWDQNKLWVDVDYETDRFASAAVFEPNRWYHVAVVYDGSAPASERVRLYVDGTLDAIAQESSAEIPAYDCDLEVGRLVNGGHTMIGMIDEVAVWRRALGADEITQLSQSALQ